jgi:PAS domain S-box-containing protein
MTPADPDQRYERAIAAAEAGFWDWHVPADDIYVSPKLLEIWGMAPETKFAGRDDFMRRSPWHPDDQASWLRAVKELFAGAGSRLSREVRIIVTGETRWLQLNGICTRDAAGQVVRWTGWATDITERKRAEARLRESEEQWKAVFEHNPTMYFMVDADGIVVSVNSFGAEQLGYTVDELIGQPVQKVFTEESRDAARAHLAACLEHLGESMRWELRKQRKDGTRLWVRETAKAVLINDRPLVLIVCEDITERKRAEVALRESEQRYERVIAAAEAGFWDWDVVADRYYVSPRLREIARLPPGRTVTSRAEIMEALAWHPDDLRRYNEAVQALCQGSGDRLEMDVRLVFPDETRWIHLNGICIRDATGAVVRWTGSQTDITERKRAEMALSQSEERYARAMEGSDAGHWDWNIVTDEMFTSPRAREMLALPAGALPASRSEIMALVPQHSDDRAIMNERVKESIRSGIHERDYRVIPRPGEVRWLRSRAKVYKDARGAAVRMTGSLIDITERKLAAEALRASEERYGLAMDASEEGHFDWNVRTDEIFVSGHLKTVLGLPLHAEFRTRSDLMSHVSYHPDDRGSLEEATRSMLIGAALRYEFEYRILRDGEQRWMRARWKIFRDEAGTATRVIGVVNDITERKLAADELRESEARFRALTELSSDWYWEQDENLRFTYLSSQAGQLTGYSGESSLGKTRWEIANMEPLSCSWAEHQAILAARKPFRDLECRRVGPDGTVRYLSMSGAPLFDEHGRFKGYQGIGRNITERKRIEEELRSRQEMLELAQQAARAIAFEWRFAADGPGQYHWSPGLAAMHGVAPESHDGSLKQYKKLIHPEDWPRVKEAIQHAQRTGEVAAEYRVLHPDGSMHWLQAKGRMLFDAERNPVRMIGFMHDVTERRQGEEELRRMERQLRQAQRLEAMGTLAGGIAHDFNNILGAILGYGEMALRDAPKGSRLRRDLDSIIVAGERGRALVDRVLAFSRSAVGERVAVHVEKVVREALDLISAKLPPNVTLHAKLHAGRAAMLGDATQVHQVLMNLATNAIQAMPSGGTLRVSLNTAHIDATRAPTIGTLAAVDYLVLKVADTGGGIAPEIIDRIFDPFFTTKEVGTGTGLGLSLVHGIVADLGGAIDVASKIGAGSSFTVYFPRSGDAPESEEDVELALPRGDGQRVLVVDDEELLVKLATRTLEDLGYAPVGFTSSSTALAAFRAEPQRFDAVITDERMPGMSGSALIREVRGIRASIPVVLMSGYLGAAAGKADEVLQKPLSARDLATSLARVLHS